MKNQAFFSHKRSLMALGMLASISFSALPTGVTLKAFYDTNAVNLRTSLAKPTSIAEVPGLPKHLFVLDLKGKLWGIFPNATGYSGLSWVNYTGTTYIKTLLADFSSDTHYSAEGEAGAYSVVFSPLYATNHKFYIWYYKNDPAWAATLPKYYPSGVKGIASFNGQDPFGLAAGDFVLDEYQTNDSATAVTRLRQQVIVVHQQPAVGSGTAKFGPDGYLYLTTGSYDGESRNLHNNLNKVLRIDVTTPPPVGASYVIPSDNPYVGALSAIDSFQSLGTTAPDYPPYFNGSMDTAIKKEIWARGFRNPWTLAFDPDSGFLWMGEIQEDHAEEINLIVKGGNYGWNRGGDLNNLGDGNYGNTGRGWSFSGPCATAANPDHRPGGDSCKYYKDPAYAAPRSGAHALQCVIAGTVFHGAKTSPFYGYLLGTDNTLDTLWAFKKGDATPQSIGHPTNFGNSLSHRGISSMASGIDGTVYVSAMDWFDPANKTYTGGSVYYEIMQLSSPDLTTKSYAELTTEIKSQNKRMMDKFTTQARLMVNLGFSSHANGKVYDLGGKLTSGQRGAGVYFLKPNHPAQ